jgi:hypothetical protein
MPRICGCCSAGKAFTKRSMVAGAEFVCTVARIRTPKLAS